MKPALYLIFIISFFACKQDADESTCYIARSNDTFEYPIKPGTNEWSVLSSSEKNLVCQIPDSTLKLISTEGLIESVLFNPLFGEIYLSNVHMQSGFDFFYENFNGIRELLHRNDVVDKMLSRYQQMNPACSHNNWPSLVGAGSSIDFSFSFVEIIIAQYPILAQIVNRGDAKVFLQEVISKNEAKVRLNYSIIGLEHSLLIAGRIMYLCNYEPFIVEYSRNEYVHIFIDGAQLFDVGTPDIITKYAKQFLTEK